MSEANFLVLVYLLCSCSSVSGEVKPDWYFKTKQSEQG